MSATEGRCRSCGASLRSTAQRYCEYCGAAVAKDAPPMPPPREEPPPIPPPVPAQAPAQPPPPRAPLAQAPETGQFEDSPGAALKVLLVSLAVGLVPCCGIGVVVLIVLYFAFARRG